jgi:hypothetical protein
VSASTFTGASSAHPRIRSAAFSAIMMTGALMLPPTRCGTVDAVLAKPGQALCMVLHVISRQIKHGTATGSAFAAVIFGSRIVPAYLFLSHKKPRVKKAKNSTDCKLNAAVDHFLPS